MPRRANARLAPGAAAFSSDNDAADNTVTQSSLQGFREAQVAILHGHLAQGPVPLSLLAEDRFVWSGHGLTLKERDQAAAALVRAGEAEYRALPELRWVWAGRRPVVHLVRVGDGQ